MKNTWRRVSSGVEAGVDTPLLRGAGFSLPQVCGDGVEWLLAGLRVVIGLFGGDIFGTLSGIPASLFSSLFYPHREGGTDFKFTPLFVAVF